MNALAQDEYWRGQTDSRIEEHDRRLDAINGSIDRSEAAVTNLKIAVEKVSTRVAIYAAVGGLIGSAFVALVGGLVLAVLTGKVG